MKFEIIIGKTYTADFQVVSDDGMTAVELDPTDTATFTLSTAGAVNETIIDAHPMTLTDAANGKFEVSLSEAQTVLLEQSVGFAEDRYPTTATYIGLADFRLTSGDRYATVAVFARGI